MENGTNIDNLEVFRYHKRHEAPHRNEDSDPKIKKVRKSKDPILRVKSFHPVSTVHGETGVESILPFIAGPSGWRERWASICDECFRSGCQCAHFRERRLRILILGHNPSQIAWTTGTSYGNPSNHFWPIMRRCGVVNVGNTEPIWRLNNMLPDMAGIGITDLGCVPGSDAATFSRDACTNPFDDPSFPIDTFAVLAGVSDHELQDFAPAIVAFTGKRHFVDLFDRSCCRPPSYGPQVLRPDGWPYPNRTEVWVLPSPSGRAAMSVVDREKPYRLLAARLKNIPWPLEAEMTEEIEQ